MIKVTVLYPNKEGAKFDLDYYLNSHTPMVGKKLGNALKGITIEHGIGGGLPGSPPPFIVICDLLFDSTEAFNAAFEPHATEIMADILNYTDSVPLVQISEVKLSR
jgi:uncharacterized protein (TIGR02118 family)